MKEQELPWNASRVLFGLSHIGYTPVEAILDIVDNSVSADAKRIDIVIKMQNSEVEIGNRTRSRAILDAIEICDDGCGMDEEGLANALTLGSSAKLYTTDTLSKFGLGLKSAAGSLGRELSLTSKVKGQTEIYRAVLDHEAIEKSGKYHCSIGKSTSIKLLKHGTEVRITKLHPQLPQPNKIIEELRKLLGMTYFFFIKEKSLQISLDGVLIEAIDPLFCDEIAKNSLLNENKWDGLTPQWLLKQKLIQIDENSTAKFTVTQLPHPPSVENAKIGTRASCREKYLIDARGYGVYVYRNQRLIGFADSLNGMIPRDQDLYSYRARLEITSEADDSLHIDVAKSQIQLSDIAEEQLRSEIHETTRKSRDAWRNRTAELNKLINESPTEELNRELDKIARDEVATGNNELNTSPVAERQQKAEHNREVEKIAPLDKATKNLVVTQHKRVLYESTLPDNQLWVRRLDPELGTVVVINEGHRLVTDLLRSDSCQSGTKALFEILMFAAAEAETTVLRQGNTVLQISLKDLDAVLQEYRITVGEKLSTLIRKVPIKTLLPD